MEFLRVFLRGLAALLDAGIPMLRALRSLCIQLEDRNFKEVVKRLIFRVSAGCPFSEAMKKEGKLFPKVIVSLVYLGEETSKLPENLARGADFIEQTMRFRAKITSSLVYPVF